tara:strand:- start:268 stop:480 length:213 start_codon:yes stop_codon:yes gene_type:complete
MLLELDPKKRLTAKDTIQHEWCQGKAKTDALDAATKSLKKYNASRKLKKVAMGVIAEQKIAKALGNLTKK